MMDQESIWVIESEQPADCCRICRFCAEIVKPWERADGSKIYGYCFKYGDKEYNSNMGKGFPIFFELDCGAICEGFKRRKENG